MAFIPSSVATMTAEERVTVIVPHFNDVERLRLCLESLEKQTFPRERYEVIVADNGTPGGIEDVARCFDGFQFISVAERGAAAARNAAMAIATGSIIAFIDADCIAHKDWLSEGVAGLKMADYCGGRIELFVPDDQHPTPVEAFELVFGFRQEWYLKRKHFSATANLFVRRHVAESIGAFVNGVAEDLDWGRRAHALGFRLSFNDRSIVNHPARRSWESLVVKWDRLTRERWNGFEKKRVAGRIAWALLAVATALSAAPHLWRVAVSRELSRFNTKLAAALVLTRIRFWRARRMIELLGAER